MRGVTAVVPVQERVLAALGMIASYSDPAVVRRWGTPPQRVPTCFTGYYRQTLADAGVLKLALATQVNSLKRHSTPLHMTLDCRFLSSPWFVCGLRRHREAVSNGGDDHTWTWSILSLRPLGDASSSGWSPVDTVATLSLSARTMR